MCLLKTCSRYQTVYGCCVWYQPFDPKLLNADQTTEAYEEASGMNSLICILSFKVWLAAFLYHLAALICLKAHTIRFYLITHLMHVNEVRSHLLLKNQFTEICSSCTIMTKNCLGEKKKSVYYREQAEHDIGKEQRLKDQVNFLKEVHIIRSIQVTIFNDVAWVTAWHSEMVESAKRKKQEGKKSRKVQKEVQNAPLAKKPLWQKAITRTVVSPDVAWLPQVATLSAEVVIVASTSSELVWGVRRCACWKGVAAVNTRGVFLGGGLTNRFHSAVGEHTTIAHQWRTRLSETHGTLRTLRGKRHAGRKQTCRTTMFIWFRYSSCLHAAQWTINSFSLSEILSYDYLCWWDRNFVLTLTWARKRRKLHLWQRRSLGIHQEIVKERHFLFHLFNFVSVFVQYVFPNKFWSLVINVKSRSITIRIQ